MSSLRDQLLAKGFATKKQAQRVDQEARRERKRAEGHKRSKREEEAAAWKREQEERARRREARQSARARYEEQREQTERALQVRNLVLGNRVGARGDVKYSFLAVDRRTVLVLRTSLVMAERLRSGQVGIAALPSRSTDGSEQFEYHVVRRAACEKLSAFAPRLLVWWVSDPDPASAPDNQFLARAWDTSLIPHRATDRDLVRFAARPAGIGTSGDGSP